MQMLDEVVKVGKRDGEVAEATIESRMTELEGSYSNFLVESPVRSTHWTGFLM